MKGKSFESLQHFALVIDTNGNTLATCSMISERSDRPKKAKSKGMLRAYEHWRLFNTLFSRRDQYHK